MQPFRYIGPLSGLTASIEARAAQKPAGPAREARKQRRHLTAFEQALAAQRQRERATTLPPHPTVTERYHQNERDHSASNPT